MADRSTPKPKQAISKRELDILFAKLVASTDNIAQAFGQINSDRLSVLINQKLASEGHLEKIVSDRFDSEGRSQDNPWAPLSERTKRGRAKLGFGAANPILERSGTLRDAATRGRITITSEGLSMEMLDRAAPVYLAPMDSDGEPDFEKSETGLLSDYASALNAGRPFYGPPTKEELGTLNERKDELVAETMLAIAEGRAVSDVFG